MDKRFLTTKELSEYLAIPEGTIRVWVCLKKIPYVKFGRAVRFDIRKIDIWVDKNSIEPAK